MAERIGWDAIVVGAGHNGLVAATYLAKAGLRTLVLERRDRAGGLVGTVEIADGTYAPSFFHTVGRLRPAIAKDLGLYDSGLGLVAPEVRVFAPRPDGRAITLWSDPARTANELRTWSPADADAYVDFDRRVRALSRFLGDIGDTTPPDPSSPTVSDALRGLLLGRAFRGLDRKDAQALLRYLPMAVADFVAEAFETDAVRAVLAWRGVRFTAMGPWSGGTTQVLLTDSAGNDGGAAGETVFARGGPGALADALVAAARAAGVEVRTNAEVVAIRTVGDRAVGVALASGEEIDAPVVASALDPKTTILSLLDPMTAGPTLRWRAGNVRTPGSVTKVNLALSSLPAFPAAGSGEDGAKRLRGRILLADGVDAVERAFDASKYGRVSDELVLEATIPSLVDRSLAPEGRHVMSVIAQWTPYTLRDGRWDDAARKAVGDAVVARLETVAPGISGLVTARQVLTPGDIERELGVAGGHPYHGEPGLDQWFAWRPMLGLARYRYPVAGMYLCGSGSHPGGGVTGVPGRNAAREIVADRKRRR
ncbi:MAG: NAD(P)/FAD-dependent oxidoreductase [Chloroflexi bacterium]|nr:NAD(P)/FAD-dependent oxidoreductase [Chloroflexota bacterium]